jgi:hypothetical protein
MRIRSLLSLAALACAPALHAQEEVALQPGALFAAVDTMYTVRTAEGVSDTVATSIQTLRRATLEGAEVWEVEFRYTSLDGSMADTTYFDTATLLPREQRRAGVTRRIEVRFDGGEVRLRRGPTRDGAPADSTELHEPGPVFTGSLMDLVFRALPLRVGLRVRIPILIPERGEVWPFIVSVEGIGIVETRDGPVEAWRVVAGTDTGEPDVLWIDRRTRALLRVDLAGGDVTIR